MTKKKHFHGPLIGKRQAAAYTFFHRPNAWAQALAKSQPLANLQQKAPASGATLSEGGVEQDLTGTVSASNHTEK